MSDAATAGGPASGPVVPGTIAATAAGLTPLLLLFGLNLVDEFDRVAFAALTPEIRDAFDLTDSGIVAIGSVSAVFVLLASLPTGYFADRYPRTRVAAIAALVWGSMAVLVGAAPVVALLFVARLFGGIARTSNEIVHPSLLADYYEPALHPRVFRIHRLATPLGGGSAIIAGVIGATLGWRWAFIVLAIPTFLLLAGLGRLREPRRGESVNAKLAAQAEADGHVPFREARRQLLRIRSLKRVWLAGFLIGVAFIAFSQLLSLFFENVYEYGAFARGVVQFAYQAGVVIGILIGGVLAARATARGDFPRLALLGGLAFVAYAVGMLLLAAIPWGHVSVVVVLLLGVTFGSYQPAYFPLIARVAPPRIRSQAYAWTLLWVGLGALLSVPLARFGENNSYRLAFVLLAVFVALGGVAGASARHFVGADIAEADRSLAADPS